MKLLIAADMEGITGVTRIEHTQSTHPEYQRFRRLMTADVNAAIAGAYADDFNLRMRIFREKNFGFKCES